MNDQSKSIELSLDQLRAIGSWASECAERAIPIYEICTGSDSRPREALDGIKLFIREGKRTTQLRKLAMAAFAAAREIDNKAAAAAAHAACLAASSAYTHPLSDVEQTKHIVGPAAYSALAIEMDGGGEEQIGDEEVRWAIEHAPIEVREVLVQMEVRKPGKSRLDRLMFIVDEGIRRG